jgi:hypothetical protein
MAVKEQRDRTHVKIPVRLKRRIKEIATDKNMAMNDIIVDAIRNYVDRLDGSYAEPDLVLDRLNQVLTSQINLTQNVSQMSLRVNELLNTVRGQGDE